MDKNKKLIIALPILLLISVFVWLPNFTGGAKNTQVNNVGDDIVSQINIQSITTFAPNQYDHIARKMSTFEVWGKNPFYLEDSFIASKMQDEELETEILSGSDFDLELSGIFWNKNKPSTLINGQVYGVGDHIGQITIVEINPQEVILVSGRDNIILYLGQ